MDTLSKEDAAKALSEIGEARDRVTTLQNYRYSAPYFLIWGTAWLVANTGSDLVPATRTWIWPVVSLIAFAGGLAVSALQFRGREWKKGKAVGWRWALMFVVIGLFFSSMFTVIGPVDYRQINAFISLFWVFLYMAAGVMFGWRLFVIGAVAAVGIMYGFLYVHSHFDLWMGVFGGGALIAGGLWLRKV